MANGQPDKVVRISLNGSGLPVPDQDPVEIKKDNQKVRWLADFDFRIDIDGYSDVKYGNGDGEYRCTSGNFSEVKKYKYSITANGLTNDPEVDVKP